MALSPIIAYSFLAAFLAFLLMYLDTKIGDNPKTKSTYIKGMAMSAAITALIIYLAGVETLPGFGSKYISGLDDEVFTGMPDF